jgi:hypothetical protein
VESSVSSLLSSHFRCSGPVGETNQVSGHGPIPGPGHAPCGVISDRLRTSSRPTFDLPWILEKELTWSELNSMIDTCPDFTLR